MKTLLKKTVFALTALVAVSLTVTGCEDEHKIKAEKLPEATRTFISQYFSGLDIVTAYKDRDDGVISYDVRLSDGTEIDFDRDGEWLEVDCDEAPVPLGVIPSYVSEYLKAHYPDAYVTKIERKRREVEVDLSNDWSLTFNTKGELIGIDD